MANDKHVPDPIEEAANEAVEKPAVAIEQVAEEIETHDANNNPVIQAVTEIMKGVNERLERIEASVKKNKTARKEEAQDGVQIKEKEAGGGTAEASKATEPEPKAAPARSKRIKLWRTL